VAAGERQDVVQVVVLTVTIATLTSREDLVAAWHRAAVHLARMQLLDVFLEYEIVEKRLVAHVTDGSAVW